MTEEPDDERDPTVLTPEELELEADAGVEQIEENRFVVSPSGEPTSSADESGPSAPDTGPREYAASESQQGAGEPEKTAATAAREPDETSSDPSSRRDGSASEERHHELNGETAFSPAARGAALEHMDRSHAIDVLLKTDDGIAERRIAADDRITVFEELLTWYASTIDDDNAPAATISALLAEADLNS
ncbi:DUF7500 family protein [Natranaeroarchaeum aerophilus]|uniref:Uncharacterized protein n=1 Tax=Natranaeroarchaeum aerophilus TaxID=2917711 RepID=A0AAE3FT53_9EURY|nr:hypothetical protein [Natranaeroarchaeum aerophilus]MCL9814650.1 hypothetical protein [Natranaeroarchaeum aerophilus]